MNTPVKLTLTSLSLVFAVGCAALDKKPESRAEKRVVVKDWEEALAKTAPTELIVNQSFPTAFVAEDSAVVRAGVSESPHHLYAFAIEKPGKAKIIYEYVPENQQSGKAVIPAPVIRLYRAKDEAGTQYEKTAEFSAPSGVDPDRGGLNQYRFDVELVRGKYRAVVASDSSRVGDLIRRVDFTYTQQAGVIMYPVHVRYDIYGERYGRFKLKVDHSADRRF